MMWETAPGPVITVPYLIHLKVKTLNTFKFELMKLSL